MYEIYVRQDICATRCMHDIKVYDELFTKTLKKVMKLNQAIYKLLFFDYV